MLRVRASSLVSFTTCFVLAAPGCELDEYLGANAPDAGSADDAGATSISKLYGLGSANNLYTLDWITRAAKLVTALAAASGDDAPFVLLEPGSYGVDFHPAADLLRVVSAYGDNLSVAAARGRRRHPRALESG